MMPGITNLPARSTVLAPAGALSWAIGPTKAILPSVITMAEPGWAGFPVPSITVTLVSTVDSARAGVAHATAVMAAAATRAPAPAAFFKRNIFPELP